MMMLGEWQCRAKSFEKGFSSAAILVLCFEKERNDEPKEQTPGSIVVGSCVWGYQEDGEVSAKQKKEKQTKTKNKKVP